MSIQWEIRIPACSVSNEHGRQRAIARLDLPPSAAPVQRVSQESSVGHRRGSLETRKIGIIQAGGTTREVDLTEWSADEDDGMF